MVTFVGNFFIMPQLVTLVLSPQQAADAKCYTSQAARRLGIREDEIALLRVVKRSIDARQRQIRVNLSLEVYEIGRAHV